MPLPLLALYTLTVYRYRYLHCIPSLYTATVICTVYPHCIPLLLLVLYTPHCMPLLLLALYTPTVCRYCYLYCIPSLYAATSTCTVYPHCTYAATATCTVYPHCMLLLLLALYTPPLYTATAICTLYPHCMPLPLLALYTLTVCRYCYLYCIPSLYAATSTCTVYPHCMPLPLLALYTLTVCRYRYLHCIPLLYAATATCTVYPHCMPLLLLALYTLTVCRYRYWLCIPSLYAATATCTTTAQRPPQHCSCLPSAPPCNIQAGYTSCPPPSPRNSCQSNPCYPPGYGCCCLRVKLTMHHHYTNIITCSPNNSFTIIIINIATVPFSYIMYVYSISLSLHVPATPVSNACTLCHCSLVLFAPHTLFNLMSECHFPPFQDCLLQMFISNNIHTYNIVHISVAL